MSATEMTRPPVVGATRPVSETATWRQVLRLTAPALVFLSVRGVGLLVLAWMAERNHRTVTAALTSWDGHWYLGLASGGYDGAPADLVDAHGRHNPDNLLAFFPGYPTVVRLFANLPGLSLVDAAFLVTVLSGLVCSYGLLRLGTRVTGGSRRAGLLLVALFAASPMAVTLSMTYSEAMFCALAAWALVGVLERNWPLAGLCCAAAGLVRPTAGALVLAVGLAALVAILRRQDGWRPWLGGLLAPLGLVGYLLWVASRTGRLDGWFEVQRQGWGSVFDGGGATIRFALDALASGRSVLEVITVGLVVLAIALVVVCLRRGVQWPLVVYAVGVLAMDLGANGLMNSKARLMVPAFTLLLPIVVGLAKRRPGTVLLTVASAAVASAWFGAYSLTAWPYAI
ncbi:glycosyltransferase family 39 protein [Kutzneria albida]|uniref:glycosyltransferase family 39 protein n=1 Tax=Kutzneria albida TaxID=43357 RepID=UPI001F46566A|nr:glycosyltransferase family 39 protein [Kutzneria albida]